MDSSINYENTKRTKKIQHRFTKSHNIHGTSNCKIDVTYFIRILWIKENSYLRWLTKKLDLSILQIQVPAIEKSCNMFHLLLSHHLCWLDYKRYNFISQICKINSCIHTPYLMADIDRAVIVVTTVVVNINIIDWYTPAWPTTQLKRRNNITPQMLSKHLISTPFIHPNFVRPFVPFSGSSPIGSVVVYRKNYK